MRDSARIAYAQARSQARFGARPGEALWRELEAGRELAHLIDILRGSALRGAVASLPAGVDPHALESRLRSSWTEACTEIAAWYPDSWQPAMRWIAVLPWVAPVGWLARRTDVPAWLRDDATLGRAAGADPTERAEALAAGPLAPLATGPEDEDGHPAAAWHDHWRTVWPEVPRTQRRALERLARILEANVPGSPSGEPFDAWLGQAEDAFTRVFRRQAGTPVAGLALLCLFWLDQLRLRAALAVACSFPATRAA